MKFFLKTWIRFAPAMAVALFFVPLIAQGSANFHGNACDCSSGQGDPTRPPCYC
jgi:hypothetical protein